MKRFWDKVDKRGSNDCWPWIGARDWRGYGRFRLGRKIVFAHRVAYLMSINALERIAEPVVIHHCNERSCVNPKHLEEQGPRT